MFSDVSEQVPYSLGHLAARLLTLKLNTVIMMKHKKCLKLFIFSCIARWVSCIVIFRQNARTRSFAGAARLRSRRACLRVFRYKSQGTVAFAGCVGPHRTADGDFDGDDDDDDNDDSSEGQQDNFDSRRLRQLLDDLSQKGKALKTLITVATSLNVLELLK